MKATEAPVTVRQLRGYRVEVRMTRQMDAVLSDMVASGLYGFTRAEAARRLLERGMVEFLSARRRA